jgi:hypothetical protein
MNDPTDATHDDLDDRIRAGLGLLVAAGPEPPQAGHRRADSSGRARSTRVLAAAAAVVLLLAGVAIAVTHRSSGAEDEVRTSPTRTTNRIQVVDPSTGVPNRPFFGTHWELVRATWHGKPVEPIQSRRPPTASFSDDNECHAKGCMIPTGPSYSFFDGCNSGGGGMRIAGHTIKATSMGSTLVGCSGNAISPGVSLAQREGRILYPTWTYIVFGNQLRLMEPRGSALIYRAVDAPFARASGLPVVAQHPTAIGEYRLVWEGPDGHDRLRLEVAVKGRISYAGVARDPLRRGVYAAKGNSGFEDIVFAVLPISGKAVIYDAPGRTSQTMRLIPIAGEERYQAAVAIVPGAAASWSVTARDRDGKVIDVDRH